MILTILSAGANINATDNLLWTPLHFACRHSPAPVIEALVQGGADLSAGNENGATALHYICGRKWNTTDYVRVQALLHCFIDAIGANRVTHKDETPLHYLCQGQQDLFVANILISKGADLLALTKRGYHALSLTRMMTNGVEPSPLLEFLECEVHKLLSRAIEQSDVEMIIKLSEVGVSFCSLDSHGRTPVSQAIMKDRQEVISTLLNVGVNIETVDDHNWTPLHIACKHGSLDTIVLLLDKGADTSALTQTRTLPLHILCGRSFEQADATRFLQVLERVHGRNDVNSVTASHETALHYCCYGKGDEKVVRYLLEHKADANAVTKRWETPLSLAKHKHLSDNVVQLLVSYGARDTSYWKKQLSSFNFLDEQITTPSTQTTSLSLLRVIKKAKKSYHGSDAEVTEKEDASTWSIAMSKRFADMIHALCELDMVVSDGECGKVEETKEAVRMLRDMRECVEVKSFTFRSNLTPNRLQQTQRISILYLITLWQWLLCTFAKFRTSDRFLVFRIVWFIVRRNEFSCASLELHSQFRRRYFRMLALTYYVIGPCCIQPDNSERFVYWDFAGRFFSLAYFRLPDVASLILGAVAKREKQRAILLNERDKEMSQVGVQEEESDSEKAHSPPRLGIQRDGESKKEENPLSSYSPPPLSHHKKSMTTEASDNNLAQVISDDGEVEQATTQAAKPELDEQGANGKIINTETIGSRLLLEGAGIDSAVTEAAEEGDVAAFIPSPPLSPPPYTPSAYCSTDSPVSDSPPSFTALSCAPVSSVSTHPPSPRSSPSPPSPPPSLSCSSPSFPSSTISSDSVNSDSFVRTPPISPTTSPPTSPTFTKRERTLSASSPPSLLASAALLSTPIPFKMSSSTPPITPTELPGREIRMANTPRPGSMISFSSCNVCTFPMDSCTCIYGQQHQRGVHPAEGGEDDDNGMEEANVQANKMQTSKFRVDEKRMVARTEHSRRLRHEYTSSLTDAAACASPHGDGSCKMNRLSLSLGTTSWPSNYHEAQIAPKKDKDMIVHGKNGIANVGLIGSPRKESAPPPPPRILTPQTKLSKYVVSRLMMDEVYWRRTEYESIWSGPRKYLPASHAFSSKVETSDDGNGNPMVLPTPRGIMDPDMKIWQEVRTEWVDAFATPSLTKPPSYFLSFLDNWVEYVMSSLQCDAVEGNEHGS